MAMIYHVIFILFAVSLGEAVLVPCTSPQRPSTRGSTSATSSHFGASSSTYDDSSNSVSGMQKDKFCEII